MKKLHFLLAMAWIWSFGVIQAQDAQNVKAHAGINLSSVTVSGLSQDILPDGRLEPGIRAGVSIDLPLKDRWSFTTGLQYVEKGFLAREGININLFDRQVPLGITARTELSYLEVPMLFKYETGSGRARPFFFAGPAIGYALDGRIKTQANFFVDINLATINLNLSDNLYNRWDISGIAGVGLQVDAGKGNLEFTAAYQHSLTDILDNPIVDVRLRNHGIQLGLGYKMKF